MSRSLMSHQKTFCERIFIGWPVDMVESCYGVLLRGIRQLKSLLHLLIWVGWLTTPRDLVFLATISTWFGPTGWHFRWHGEWHLNLNQCTKRLRITCQNTEVDIIHWVRTMFTAFPARYLSRAREPSLLTWMLIDKDLFDCGKLLEEGTHSNSCYEKTKKCPKSWILSEKSFTLPRDSGFYSILNTWVLMWGFSWLEPPIPIIPSQVRFPSREKSSMNLIV